MPIENICNFVFTVKHFFLGKNTTYIVSSASAKLIFKLQNGLINLINLYTHNILHNKVKIKALSGKSLKFLCTCT